MYSQLKVNNCRNHRFQLRGHKRFEFFFVVTKKNTFLMRTKSKFRLCHVQEKVRTYLCVKFHVSKSCRFFRNRHFVFFNLCPCVPYGKIRLPSLASLTLMIKKTQKFTILVKIQNAFPPMRTCTRSHTHACTRSIKLLWVQRQIVTVVELYNLTSTSNC